MSRPPRTRPRDHRPARDAPPLSGRKVSVGKVAPKRFSEWADTAPKRKATRLSDLVRDDATHLIDLVILVLSFLSFCAAPPPSEENFGSPQVKPLTGGQKWTSGHRCFVGADKGTCECVSSGRTENHFIGGLVGHVFSTGSLTL